MPTLWPFTDLLRLGSYVTNDLAHIRSSLAQLVTEVIIMSGKLQTTIDQLKADVAAEHDGKQAVVKALNGLAAQLKAALDAGKSGDTDQMIADLESLHTTLSADTADLADAVVANTPAETAPPPAPPPAAVPASDSTPPDGTAPASGDTPATPPTA